LEEILARVLEFSNSAAARRVGLRMENDKMEEEYRRGSIYKTKKAVVFLTCLLAVSVKSEGVQVDMVTVRMVIKGLRR